MGHRILLADDSLTIQKVVELTFSETDYELMAVGSGDRAVEALDEFRPDIVLADVVMPGLTGYEVCERVKKRPDGAAIPVVLLTGTFEPFDRSRAERAGCDSIVTKPFDSHALAALVRQLIVKGEQIRADLAAAPPPLPPPPVQAPAFETPDPFGDTIAYRQPEAAAPAGVVEDIFAGLAPAVPEPPAAPAMVEPAIPVAAVPEPEMPEAAVEEILAAAAEPAAPRPYHVDEDTHPLLVISPPPPAEEEPESLAAEDVQPRDIERDLEAFEQTGQGRSRPEVWEQAEALGVLSRVETSGEHTAVDRIHPSARDNGDLEALAAQARMTDLAELIPATREPVPVPEQVRDQGPAAASGLSDAEVERIARRVIQMIGEKIIREVAWDVVPETAERVVRERLAEIEKG
jgi:CheY-like chemotaxis protein